MPMSYPSYEDDAYLFSPDPYAVIGQGRFAPRQPPRYRPVYSQDPESYRLVLSKFLSKRQVNRVLQGKPVHIWGSKGGHYVVKSTNRSGYGNIRQYKLGVQWWHHCTVLRQGHRTYEEMFYGSAHQSGRLAKVVAQIVLIKTDEAKFRSISIRH